MYGLIFSHVQFRINKNGKEASKTGKKLLYETKCEANNRNQMKQENIHRNNKIQEKAVEY